MLSPEYVLFVTVTGATGCVTGASVVGAGVEAGSAVLSGAVVLVVVDGVESGVGPGFSVTVGAGVSLLVCFTNVCFGDCVLAV